jgi:tRNA(Ile)-lysidine synthase
MAVKLVEPKNYRKTPDILDSDFENILFNLGVKKEFCIAASGGPDSLCLILLANKFALKNNYKMSVLTVDHQLRKESSEESIWLNKILKRIKIKHYILKWNGKKPKSNVMETARLKRYELMTDKCLKLNIKHLLTAHHLDDQIENFFMRLVRGSGLKGLSSISKSVKMNGIKVIRPLLEYQKKSLIKVLANNNQKYVQDPSNDNSKYDRIRYRKLIGGLIDEGLNKNRLNKLILNLNQVDDAINYSTLDSIDKTISQNKYGNIIIDRNIFFKLPKELQFRVLLFVLNNNESKKKRIKSESIIMLIDVLKSRDFKRHTLNKNLFINKKHNILVVKEVGRIKSKESIKKKNFVWRNVYKINIKTQLTNDLKIGFADDSFDKKNHFKEDKLLINSMPAIWKKDKIISIPFLDKRKKLIATCTPIKISEFNEFKMISN